MHQITGLSFRQTSPQQIGFGDAQLFYGTFCMDISIYWVLGHIDVHLFGGHSFQRQQQAAIYTSMILHSTSAGHHSRSHSGTRGYRNQSVSMTTTHSNSSTATAASPPGW
ncbi:hypothetical protein TNCT_7021 [Trichonephila clavata]|uniref:Uncharacterized protein n=1 Tax=Trichonephila clavata TaxID=2740835 RepID=A0A8X6FUG1_TRICU|nr:hypothetical protein TNCT_7021 [Trichonephila clavata]